MSTAMTSAPSDASRTASARPCPRAAPVMNATLPSRAAIGVRLLAERPSGTQLRLGRVAADDGLQQLDVRRAVEMLADLAEERSYGRGGAVGFEGVGIGPLLDEDERSILGLVQGIELTTGLLVHPG